MNALRRRGVAGLPTGADMRESYHAKVGRVIETDRIVISITDCEW